MTSYLYLSFRCKFKKKGVVFVMNKQLTTQYFNFIKQSGYEYSKDDLGFYFNNGLKRYSIMKTGPFFTCYYNKQEKSQWILKDKSMSMTDFVQCLIWVLKSIQTSK